MSIETALQDADKKMKSSIESMVHDFGTYRTGRASLSVLERVHVEAYGADTPINQVANVSIPEPRQILIQPYDKSLTQAIERAILKSDLGISPTTDGTGIRLNFPQMTEDRRKELVKQVHARTEVAKISIRNVRREANDQMKALEKKKEISSDEMKTGEAKVQKMTDSFIAQIDDLGKKKEQELLSV